MLHLFFHLTIAERDRAVGKLPPTRIMADHNNCSTLLADLLAEDFTDVLPGLSIKGRSRFIGE
jgi:hypothetical protein